MDYNIMWAKPYEHLFETLRQGEIQWYAVITYEALVVYRDAVINDLMEVIKSGMRRHGKPRAADVGRKRGPEGNRVPEPDPSSEEHATRQHRRLPVRDAHADPTTYLVPKGESRKLWGECTQNQRCARELDGLTDEVFPFFGYVSVAPPADEGGAGDDVAPSTSRLSPAAGIVSVSREFGRVLYTSEAAALRRARKEARGGEDGGAEEEDRPIDYTPPAELIANLKAIFS